MDSRYTNREKYLDAFSNKDFAEILKRLCECGVSCPLEDIGICPLECNYENTSCEKQIEKWLGEKA